LIEAYAKLLLEQGGTSRLLGRGELKEVVALDETGALERANLVRPEGTVKFDGGKVRDRQDAMVNMLASRPEQVLVIVLGGAHDLSASVKELAPGAE
jgi:hypothetical protein